MTTKTIMMAVAAAMGLAASAGVIEVKFTVKTDVASKVASKVITGLYDQESGKHVFWTTEKVANDKGKLVNTNVAIQKSYFGLVNEKEVAKKIGQNAELIWGENDENVLVAGAWGSDKSKSGQVAGTFNGNPATGTWSAKLNTKKTLEALLAKYKVQGFETVENKEQGVIGAAEAAKAAAEAAKAAAEADAAQAKADKAEAEAAKAAAEAAKAAAEEAKAAAESAKAEADQKRTEAEAAAVAAEEAKAEADQKLADATDKLEVSKAEMEQLKGMFKEIDDPNMPEMFSEYLDANEAQATAIKNEAKGFIDAAEGKFASYTNALDAIALEAAVAEAKAARDAAQEAFDTASNTVEALVTTNSMIAFIDAETIDSEFDSRKAAKQLEIDRKQAEIDAAQLGFEDYKSNLAANVIPALEAELPVLKQTMDEKKEALKEADEANSAARTALEGFVEPTYENGGIEKSLDAFVAEKEAAGEVFVSEIAKLDAYEDYKKEVIAEAKRPLQEAADAASADYLAAQAASESATFAYNDTTRQLEEAKASLKTAEETGTTPALEDLKAELETLKEELVALDEELKFWKAYRFSDDDRTALREQITAAEGVKAEKEAALDAAESDLADAQNAVANQSTVAAERLADLAAEIGKTLTDADGNALSVAAIRAAVDSYVNDPRGDKKSYAEILKTAEDTLAAIGKIREELAL